MLDLSLDLGCSQPRAKWWSRYTVFISYNKVNSIYLSKMKRSLDIQIPPGKAFYLCFFGSKYLLKRCLDV